MRSLMLHLALVYLLVPMISGWNFLEWLTQCKQTTRIENERNMKFREGVRQALRLQQGLNLGGETLQLQCSGGRIGYVEESVDCVEMDGRCCSVKVEGFHVPWYQDLAPGDYYACGFCWSGAPVYRMDQGNRTPPAGDSVMAVTGMGVLSLPKTGEDSPMGKTGVNSDRGIFDYTPRLKNRERILRSFRDMKKRTRKKTGTADQLDVAVH